MAQKRAKEAPPASKGDAVVLRFPQGGRAQGAAQKPLPPDPKPMQFEPKSVLDYLGGSVPLPDELAKLMELPETLYLLQSVPYASFSSDPSKGIANISGQLLMGNTLAPDDLVGQPDYGIHMSRRGSSAFCTLLDKRRKIIVRGSLGNEMAADLEWGQFARYLEKALRQVKERESRGEAFDLLLCDEGGMTPLRI